MALENLLQQMENVGDEKKPKYQAKYRLSDLLDPEYRIGGSEALADFGDLKGIAGITIEGFG